MSEQAIFGEIVVRLINSLSPLHRLLPHLTDASDHAACSHRDNEALGTEKSTTSWSAKARDLYTSKCREATDPTATMHGPDRGSRSRRPKSNVKDSFRIISSLFALFSIVKKWIIKI